MRKYIIIGGFLVFAIFLVLVYWLVRSPVEESEVVPTPTPTGPEVELLQTVPEQGTRDVPLTREIVLTFSEPVTKNDLKILAGPNTDLFEAFRGKTVIVRPRTQWMPGVENRITVQYADLSRIPDSITFTTVGTTPDSLPDTAPDQSQIKQSEDLQREVSPDVYLSNFTPFDTERFHITSNFSPVPAGHFAFVVLIKQGSENEIRAEVEQWARSHGLTDAQIASLVITYQ